MKTLPFISGPICGYCGRPARLSKDSCPDCAGRGPHFASARSVWIYEGPVRQIIHDLKYRNNKLLAVRVARHMSPLASDTPIVTWVPMTRGKRWARGYNQAELLARGVAGLIGATATPLLVRTRETAEQNRLNPRERLRNVSGAFSLRPGVAASGPVLLIDDVFTTGATADECSRILRAGDCGPVHVLTAARAI